MGKKKSGKGGLRKGIMERARLERLERGKEVGGGGWGRVGWSVSMERLRWFWKCACDMFISMSFAYIYRGRGWIIRFDSRQLCWDSRGGS